MFEEAARLIRLMDAVFDSTDLDPRTRLQRGYQLAHQVSDALSPFWVAGDWKISPWPNVDIALGQVPLKHEAKINDLLDSLASGAIPNWCFEWLRAG